MMKTHLSLRILFVLLCSSSLTFAQSKVRKFDLYKLLQEGEILNPENRKAEPLLDGKVTGLHITESAGDGVVWLKGVTFTNGTIEFDAKGKDVLQRSFLGIAFHGVDETKFDAVYFRPFNFQSADSVRRIHAVQYESLPDFPWDRLRKEHNGKSMKKQLHQPPILINGFM